MVHISFAQRLKIGLTYCFPALLASALIMYSYHCRLVDVAASIKIGCRGSSVAACLAKELAHCDQEIAGEKVFGAAASGSDSPAVELSEAGSKFRLKFEAQICEYRKKFADDNGYLSASVAVEEAEPGEGGSSAYSMDFNDVQAMAYMSEIGKEVDANISQIFFYNLASVFLLVLLPYLLMGDLLAKSDRILLDFSQRVERAHAHWVLKFLVALIMGIGLLYILNPLGRGGSAYHQFFISVGLGNENTLPIYIKAEQLVPVLAGFLGWYLHLIGYTFTKLIHHDVISARVYGMLFRKFIVTYGIALTIPAAGILGESDSAAFFMFLIGLFPLTAMSVLIEAVSKFASSNESSGGLLTQLPGISRWQILRLEEEGIDSMASLANTEVNTIKLNLQVLGRLTWYWVDIAQLYTIVGQESYNNIKGFCLTASEFIRKASDPEFAELIRGVEGVSHVEEISRLLQSTFKGKLVVDADINDH